MPTSSNMRPSKPGLRFVQVGEPGHKSHPDQAFAVRSHVRRTVAHENHGRPRAIKVRFAPVATSANGVPRGRKRKATQVDEVEHDQALEQQALVPNLEALGDDSGYQTAETCDLEAIQFFDSCIPSSPVCLHPFAIKAAQHVDLSVERLDELFKSNAYRYAAEPVFDIQHVDSPLSMEAVFPTCGDDPAFYNAVCYSILQTANRGKFTLEQCHIKSQTISALNKSLASGSSALLSSSTAAIIILKVTAYKWEDRASHELHSQGLLKAIQSGKVQLTPAALRAIFWQDLFAAVLLSTPRRMTHSVLPDQIQWLRIRGFLRPIPNGFVRHRAALPDNLMECIQDVQELQAAATNCSEERIQKYTQLDTMQADIESRLAFQAEACRSFGPVATATRLAIFIVTYAAFTETWDSSYVPGRLAEQLLNTLEPFLHRLASDEPEEVPDVWSSRRDLQLWLLFIGTSIAELDNGFAENIRYRYGHALRLYGQNIARVLWTQKGLEATTRIMQSALNDFLYPKGWSDQRLGIMEWFELELQMDACPRM